MAETPATPAAAPKPKKKRERKVGINGIAHVQSTFNNTIVTITDMDGHTVAWASAGKVGFNRVQQLGAKVRRDWHFQLHEIAEHDGTGGADVCADIAERTFGLLPASAVVIDDRRWHHARRKWAVREDRLHVQQNDRIVVGQVRIAPWRQVQVRVADEGFVDPARHRAFD